LTRDAEEKIDRALRSVAGLGAEIIVGDTGSTDRTAAVARALEARVVPVSWQQDFASAQNQLLDQASGDWVFWLNPDEELRHAEPLAPLLARTDVLAYLVQVENVMRPDELECGPRTLLPRLFRRRPDVRFLGRLHPHFAPPLEEIARREHLQFLPADIVLRRHGYLSVLTAAKLRWTNRLLELELADRPGQLHYLIEYGRNLLRLNDPRGHEVLAEAAEQVLAAGDAPLAPAPTVGSLLEYLLTVAPAQSRSRLTPDQARQLAERWFPAAPPLLWALAQNAFQAGDFQEAARLLEKLLHLGRTGTYDTAAAFDPEIVAERALLNLATCHLHLGVLPQAEQIFTHLLSSPKYQAQAQKGLALSADLRRRS
jgi:hypothetical protein